MTDTRTIDIRPTREADLAPLRALIVETWHATYDATMGADRVTAITNDWHSLERLTREIEHPKAISLIATEGDRLLGHVLLTNLGQQDVQLARLYVNPTAQHGGIGTSLLNATLNQTDGATSMSLEVEEANSKARDFYAKHGFKQIERHSNCGDQDEIPTLILRKFLSL